MIIFGFSDQEKARKAFRCFSASALLIMIIFTAALAARGERFTAYFQGNSYSVRAETDSDIRRFARFFNLAPEEEPSDVRTVTIPLKFNNYYSGYNALQEPLGLNLLHYQGCTCQLYTYRLSGTPELLHLLIFRNRIIGGDIADEKFDGGIFYLAKYKV